MGDHRKDGIIAGRATIECKRILGYAGRPLVDTITWGGVVVTFKELKLINVKMKAK